MSKGDSRQRKADYFTKLHELLDGYSKILIVEADNVGSNQMHKIRISLRGKAIILMGKNTMVRKAIRARLSAFPALEKILPHVTGNVGFVFTNEDLRTTRDTLLKERTIAPAKAGAMAPLDVFIEAQNTGMGPEKTSFYQALGIATKISKGTIEIMNRVHLIKKGEKVGPSEATLLNMLAISPFTYGLVVRVIYDNGTVFTPDILDIADSQLLQVLTTAVKNVTCLSLAVSFPTVASVPHSVIRAYKDTLSVALGTEYSFPLADKIKEYLANPSKFAAVVQKQDTPAHTPAQNSAPTKEEKAPEKEESDEEMGFGLFD